jgi:hypothetical protein
MVREVGQMHELGVFEPIIRILVQWLAMPKEKGT